MYVILEMVGGEPTSARFSLTSGAGQHLPNNHRDEGGQGTPTRAGGHLHLIWWSFGLPEEREGREYSEQTLSALSS